MKKSTTSGRTKKTSPPMTRALKRVFTRTVQTILTFDEYDLRLTADFVRSIAKAPKTAGGVR
jgi:hypothetical protein